MGDKARGGSSRRPDPRCVFALSVYLSLFAVLSRTLWLMGALLALALLSALLLRVNLSSVLRKLKRLWQIILAVAILQSVFSPSGQVWVEIGGLTLLTSGGALMGAVVLCRLAILLLTGSLFMVYRARELIQAMIQLKLPYEIVYMVSVGVRFVPMMGQELRDSLTALALRGVVIKELKLRRRLKVYTYLLLPAVAGSLHRAQALAMSMEMRGFRAYPRRTSFFALSFHLGDCVVMIAAALLTILTGVAYASGY